MTTLVPILASLSSASPPARPAQDHETRALLFHLGSDLIPEATPWWLQQQDTRFVSSPSSVL